MWPVTLSGIDNSIEFSYLGASWYSRVDTPHIPGYIFGYHRDNQILIPEYPTAYAPHIPGYLPEVHQLIFALNGYY